MRRVHRQRLIRGLNLRAQELCHVEVAPHGNVHCETPWRRGFATIAGGACL